MDSVDRLWDRIEAWLAANAPEIAAALPPGVTKEEIRQVEAAMDGLVLPEDVKASYLRHNGYASGSFLMNQSYFCDLAHLYVGPDTVEARYGAEHQGVPEEVFGPIQPVWWHRAWLLLAGTYDHDYLLIDLAPAPGGQAGQIIKYHHTDGPTDVIAPSFQALLSTFADALEFGKYASDGLYLFEAEEEDVSWQPADHARSNIRQVRRFTGPDSPLISTRAIVPRHAFAASINTLYRVVRASLVQRDIQPLITYTMTVLVRYEDAPDGKLVLEVGIAVEEARSDDPDIRAGTLPDGPSAMLPQVCYFTPPDQSLSKREALETFGPSDLYLIAEEGVKALEQWSAHRRMPLTGQPWLIFLVDPRDPQAVPIPDTFVRFEVHRLLANAD